jgi:hypothetical protein
MILSHRHQFIFIKTLKSAGTSLELALRQVCGPEDVITPITPRVPGSQPRDAQNYLRGEADRVYRDGLYQPLVERDFFNHMPLAKVISYAGQDAVSGYFKFTFVRNPWDRQVSLYYFRKFHGLIQDSFLDWMRIAEPLATLSLLKLSDRIAMDFIGRYENLAEDFAKVCRHLGVAENAPTLPHAKGGIRPAGSYRDRYNAWSRERVAEMYADEIALFGYEF